MFAFTQRAFGRTNLRPVVIGFSLLGAAWSLAWTVGAFEDVSDDKQDNVRKLVNFDIALGAVYASVAAIELFGVFAAITRRHALARLNVALSCFVILAVAGAQLLTVVVHFLFKSQIIQQCTLDSTGDTIRSSWFWGSSSHTLTQSEAQDFCNDAYSRGSASTIIWFLATAVFTLFNASLAYAFYKQLLDPTFSRERQTVPLQAYVQYPPPGPYAQQSVPNLPYAPYPNAGPYGAPAPGAYANPNPFEDGAGYAPPAGPPPGFGYGQGQGTHEGKEYGSAAPAKEMNDEKEVDGVEHELKPVAEGGYRI